MRKPWRRSFLAGAVFAAISTPSIAAASYSYYPAGPVGQLYLTRPTIQQTFLFDEAGDSFDQVQMWFDGVAVTPVVDRGAISYTPPSPLTPGEHKVKMFVHVHSGTPNTDYLPQESEFAFTVAPTALPELPPITAGGRIALQRINSIRKAGGVEPVRYNLALDSAATSHSLYMAVNDYYQHDEQIGKPHFVGSHPSQRTVAYGYSPYVSEDIVPISYPVGAVDSWMDAPYHRFSIISPSTVEIGFGTAGRYATLDAGVTFTSEAMVVWPFDGQQGVATTWWANEIPNPLRLYPGVQAPVGSAISLQFGASARSVSLSSASLTAEDGSDVPVLKFSPANDDRLRSEMFMLPKTPMKDGTRYTARMTGTVTFGDRTVPFAKTWSFTTNASNDFPDPFAAVAPPVDGNAKHFQDTQGHWAVAHIGRLAAVGVVDGYPDGEFQPDAPLTRAAFVKMLVTAQKLEVKPGADGGFMDTASHWLASQGYIDSAVKAGIVKLEDYAQRTFEPDRPITRDEIATMVVRAANLPVLSVMKHDAGLMVVDGMSFKNVDQWPHPGYTLSAIKYGIVTGYRGADSQFEFKPDNKATRAEACVMVSRMLDIR